MPIQPDSEYGPATWHALCHASMLAESPWNEPDWNQQWCRWFVPPVRNYRGYWVRHGVCTTLAHLFLSSPAPLHSESYIRVLLDKTEDGFKENTNGGNDRTQETIQSVLGTQPIIEASSAAAYFVKPASSGRKSMQELVCSDSHAIFLVPVKTATVFPAPRQATEAFIDSFVQRLQKLCECSLCCEILMRSHCGAWLSHLVRGGSLFIALLWIALVLTIQQNHNSSNTFSKSCSL